VLFANIHRKFNQRLSENAGRWRAAAFTTVESEVLQHEGFLAEFHGLCMTLSPPPTMDAISMCYHKVVLKWLHAREAEYLRLANQDRKATLAFRVMLAASRSGVARPQPVSLDPVLDMGPPTLHMTLSTLTQDTVLDTVDIENISGLSVADTDCSDSDTDVADHEIPSGDE
jgi:hypothetical protein